MPVVERVIVARVVVVSSVKRRSGSVRVMVMVSDCVLESVKCVFLLRGKQILKWLETLLSTICNHSFDMQLKSFIGTHCMQLHL